MELIWKKEFVLYAVVAGVCLLVRTGTSMCWLAMMLILIHWNAATVADSISGVAPVAL
jgi:hypothetical protein